MRLTRSMRPLAICLALAVSFGLAACSSSDETDTAGGESTKTYCEAVQSIFALQEQAGSGAMPPADIDKAVDFLREASTAAPAAVRGDFWAAFLGDQYAQEDLAQYNKDQCGIDVPTPTATP